MEKNTAQVCLPVMISDQVQRELDNKAAKKLKLNVMLPPACFTAGM